MNRLCFALSALLLAACVQRLPDAHDMDAYYKWAEKEFATSIADLEHRRSSGQVDDAGYQRERTALNRRISNRAMTLAWTSHDLRERELEAHGIPTPDHPQDIRVPGAGSLPTGSEFRRFNQNDFGYNQGAATTTDMQQLIGAPQNPGLTAAQRKQQEQAQSEDQPQPQQ